MAIIHRKLLQRTHIETYSLYSLKLLDYKNVVDLLIAFYCIFLAHLYRFLSAIKSYPPKSWIVFDWLIFFFPIRLRLKKYVLYVSQKTNCKTYRYNQNYSLLFMHMTGIPSVNRYHPVWSGPDPTRTPSLDPSKYPRPTIDATACRLGKYIQ